ncbi:hypothetical protein ACFSHT_22315 [Paraburkholderia silviterrae]|uniref:Uncharacterized protein n=1 Tax=Paraburkholderia silviterrae TaxID=2528715 RepID=A0A4R5MFA5_9BURK|nr:hypothetical protein [Paraburkholderia silviterrae]TDG25882.1 hypothetical protein EYW47_00485 [Paraburkholderia silviterrae]
MKAFKAFAAIVGLCVSMPIWYVLVYKMLAMMHATDVMWLLYWIYMPAGILVSIIFKICELAEKK